MLGVNPYQDKFMKCSIYIATSADGYIATIDGKVDWLQTAENQTKIDIANHDDMGFNRFINSIDCMIMGRKCMETIANMNLTSKQWPYGNIPITVLSQTLKNSPQNIRNKVEIYSGEIPALIEKLTQQGYKHAYIDGGEIITAFINLKLIEEMIITQAPVLLGEGISLFGKLNQRIKLENAEATAFKNNFIQTRYCVNYS